MVRFRWFLGLFLAAGIIISVWAQSPNSSLTPTLLTQQLQREYPGVLVYTEGDQVRRVWGKPFGYGSSAIESAQAFVNRYAELFSPGASNLALNGVQDVMRGKFTAVYFQQQVDGIPVDKGELTLLVREMAGYPLVLASNAVRFVNPISTTPKLSDDEAIQIAAKLRPDLKLDSKPELIIYPHEEHTHLAWAFSVDKFSLAQPERYRVFVDAHTGELLEWRSEVYHNDITGQVRGNATPGLRPDSTANPPQLRVISKLRVSVVGGGSIFSAIDGRFTLSSGGASSATVRAELIGPNVRVNDQAGSTMVLQQTVNPPAFVDFLFNATPTEFNTAQLNGLIHTQIVYDFVKSINPNYPGVDIQIPCNVNIANTCNAYYSNRTINFYQAGNGCVNTCYSTVIYHEYGHFIIAMGHPNASGDYHEGIADVTAAFLTVDPCLGIEFRGVGTGCLRNSVNDRRHPCSGGVHFCGQVISGAFWQTWLEMRNRYSNNPQFALDRVREWYLNSILIRPTGISPQITIDVLTLDDNDGDIYNGTPHYAQIATGFARHNLPAPQLDWLRIEPLTLPGAIVAPPIPGSFALPLMRFSVRVSDLEGQRDMNAVFLHYRVNRGAWQTVRMNRVGNDGAFTAVPVPACGGNFEYYIEARDTQARSTFYPRGGANAPLSTLSALSLQVAFEDTFENNLGWSVQNDSSLTAGAWTRGAPRGTFQNGQPANPGSDSPDPGSICAFTGQGSAGGSVGEADVDGGPTYLTSPVINLAGADAIIEYSRWFFNGTALNDTFWVEVSNDNGATWTRVETVAFTGSENRWVRRSFRVGDYVTPTAQVRVRFGTSDNPNDSIVEAGVDHFVVRRIVCP
ncbi:MAG: PepSY domain-containing protein [Fimbriimonadales bacterium]|nr:PepSY domain-containing protein [Fimbriimonadales bacterium]